jgi:OmcA/MtrC family decaheme c-type cytochrome
VTINPASATTNPGVVVNFKMADRVTGAAIVGFGSKTQASGATVASYPNLAFSIAKLVPSAGGSPSRWVNYIVTSISGTGVETLTRPSTDNQGTLVDNGDGTYKYTFRRDVAGMAAKVASLTAPTGSDKADLDDLSYNANATHRLTIQIAGNAPGTGTNTPNAVQVVAGVPMDKPVNVIYDFVPATGQAPAASANRKMVANANCESCHSTLGGLPGQDEASLLFHGGSRNNIEYCVICHTEQRKFGRPAEVWNSTTRAFTGSTYRVDGQAVGNVMSFLHKIHVAGVMTRTNYDYAGVLFDKGGYSQDIRNCDKCHDSTGASTGGTPLPQAALWKTEANRKACSSCHDGINFDTGQGLTLADKAAGKTVSTDFFGKAHPDNSTDGTCLNSSCHNAGAPGDPDLVHKPVTPPNKGSALHVAGGNTNTNSAWIASNNARLPEGAIKVAYDVKEVRLANGAARNPQIVFRMLQNGVVTPFQDPTTAPNNPATSRKEIWANFMGSPSCYFVWAVPQDGVTAPQDYNVSASGYLRTLWLANGAVGGSGAGAGTLTAGTGAEAGYYLCTLTNVSVANGATMFAGGMGYSYNVSSTLPLTQTNLTAYPVPDGSGLVAAGASNPTGGLIVIAPNAQKAGTGFTARRAIVEDKRCNACHQELGTFTEDAFHAGQRNDGTTCTWCHKPNQTSSAWSADATSFVHAIHAGAKRKVPYTWHASSTTESFADIKYPGVLARCEQCHIPGSYDFTNSASADAVGLGADQTDKRLPKTVGVGYYVGTAGGTTRTISGAGCTTFGTSSAQTAVGVFSLAPYVTANGTGNAATPNSGQFYGYGFSHNATATPSVICPLDGSAPVTVGALSSVDASPATLVTSPTVTVCASCHDSDIAVSHMKLNGGTFYEPRSAWASKTEQCFVCHASGRTAGITEVHKR